MARRHALHADGQRDRHDRRQAFGNCRNRQADHHHEGVAHRVAAEEDGEEEDQRRDRQNAGSELRGEAVHLAHQRRLQRFDRAEQHADAAEFRLLTGRHGNAGALAGSDEGAGKSHRPAVADAGALLDRHRRLVGRHRFAGEDRLVDAQAPRPDQADVGGHPRPGFDEHEIAGNDRIGADGDAMAVAQHRRLGVDHAADGLQRLRRLAFLDEADGRIGQRHRQHDAGIDPVAERRRKHRRRQQGVDEDVVELEEEARQGAAPCRPRQPVRPEDRQPRLSFIRIESLLAAGERLQRRLGVQGMPRPLGNGSDRRICRRWWRAACRCVHRPRLLRSHSTMNVCD